MNRLKPINEELHNRVVSVAYGDASLIDRIRVYFEGLKNSEVKKLLAEYKETAATVNSIASEECPDEIIDSINNKIKQELSSSRKDKQSFGILIKKPAIVFATAVIVLGIFTLIFLNKPENKTQYSKAQVESAEKQVKKSLALVGEVFRKTQYKLADDVLGKQVSPPIKKSMNLINDLFKGG